MTVLHDRPGRQHPRLHRLQGAQTRAQPVDDLEGAEIGRQVQGERGALHGLHHVGQDPTLAFVPHHVLEQQRGRGRRALTDDLVQRATSRSQWAPEMRSNCPFSLTRASHVRRSSKGVSSASCIVRSGHGSPLRGCDKCRRFPSAGAAAIRARAGLKPALRLLRQVPGRRCEQLLGERLRSQMPWNSQYSINVLIAWRLASSPKGHGSPPTPRVPRPARARARPPPCSGGPRTTAAPAASPG